MPAPLAFDGPRLIRSEELRASHRLSQICFEDIPDSGEEEEPELPLQFDDGETYLIACQGQPVSQISIFHTPLQVENGVVHVGSIGGVCTHPDFRGYGLATRLMDHCTQRLVQGGAGLMLISGGRGLYTRLGCVPTGRFAEFHFCSGELPTPGPEISLRPLTPADAAWCSQRYHAEPVHFPRPLSLFEKYFQPHGIGFHAEEWAVEQAGSPVAYLMLSVPWDHLNQPNAGVRSICEYAGSREALAGALAAALAQPGIREITFPVAWQDSGFIRMLQQWGGRPQWAALQDHTMRIINFPAFMEALLPYLEDRLAPQLRRELRFEQSGPLLNGIITGSSDDAGSRSCCGHCAIICGPDRLELDTASMTYLVMGDPRGVLGSAVPLPGKLAEVVPALFPLPAFFPGLNYH